MSVCVYLAVYFNLSESTGDEKMKCGTIDLHGGLSVKRGTMMS